MKKFLVLIAFLGMFSLVSAQVRFDRIDSIQVRHLGQNLINPWAGGLNYPLISDIDLDGDGRQDLFIFDRHDNRLLTFINSGDTSTRAWQFAPSYAAKFPPVNKWALLYDYNCDGKKDFFTLSSLFPSGIAAWRNDYTPGTGLKFTLVDPFMQEQFGASTFNIFASYISIPAFADFDGDGDMDILGYNSVPDGRFIFHQNMSKELFGHCDSLKFQYATGCWGNFTLRIGSTNSVACFHCPCRTAAPGYIPYIEEPVFFNPEDAARRDDTISSIYAIDLDGDQDMELLIGDISSTNSLMVRNGGTPAAAEMDMEDQNYPSADTPALFNGFHFHAYIDVNNDGKKDLLVMASEYENRKGIWWYRNVGTNSNPDFRFQSSNFLQDQMIDVGENSSPVLFDQDGDGLPDLVIGATEYESASVPARSRLYLYRNSGSATLPRFEYVSNDFANITGLSYSGMIYPSFGDLDNDGDLDMLLGLEDGTLQYFNNSAGVGNPANFQLAIPNFMGIDVGSFSTPQIIDLNRDGKLDLVVGEKNGFINYFQNSGTISSPFFTNLPTEDTLGCIVRQGPSSPDGFTVPFVYDSLGKYRMLVSNMEGNVFMYSNIDGNLNGCFTLKDSLFNKAPSSRVKYNVTVSGGNLNGDQLTDLVLGSAAGGVNAFMQYNPTANIGFLQEVRPGLDVYPNPASDKIYIRIRNVREGKSFVRVLDTSGRELFRQSPVENEVVLDVAGWDAGLYFVQLYSGIHIVSRKLIVQPVR